MDDYFKANYINHRDPLVSYYRTEYGSQWFNEYLAYSERRREMRNKAFINGIKRFFHIKVKGALDQKDMNPEQILRRPILN